jgi:hypothetical protein
MDKMTKEMRDWSAKGESLTDTTFAMARDMLLMMDESEFKQFKNMATLSQREFFALDQRKLSSHMATLVYAAFNGGVVEVVTSAIKQMCDCAEGK